jgi:hypothetical protein
MRIAGDLSTVTSCTSTTAGAYTTRWCPPEILDPERYGSKGSGPARKSDIYSMAMTIYEVSILRRNRAEALTRSQVLTDRIPFYEYHSDLTAMLHITRGELPKKPVFAITRGYTQELWDMTSSCWDVDPPKRPAVDHVLDSLVVAADLWKPKGNQLSAPSWDPTASEALEPETEPVDDAPHPSQPLAPNTLVPAPPSATETAAPATLEKESGPDATSGKFIRKTTRYFSRLVNGKAA